MGSSLFRDRSCCISNVTYFVQHPSTGVAQTSLLQVLILCEIEAYSFYVVQCIAIAATPPVPTA